MKCKLIGTPYYPAADAFAIVSPFLIVRGWLDGPNTVAGVVVGVDGGPGSAADHLGARWASRKRRGREGEKKFLFAGTRAQFVGLFRKSRVGMDVLNDPRVVVDPSPRTRDAIISTDPGEGLKRESIGGGNVGGEA